MDELEVFKAARPVVPAYAEQDREAARIRLLAAAAGTDPERPGLAERPRRGVRLRRLAWQAAVAGGLAVAITAAVTVAQIVSPRGEPPAATPVANAAELARHAAAAATAQPDFTLAPGQWLYSRLLYAKVRPGPGVWSGVLPTRQPVEMWRRFDGGDNVVRVHVRGDMGPLHLDFLIMGSARLTVRDYARWERSLPTQPDALLARVYREVDSYPRQPGASADIRYQRAFIFVSLLLGDNVLSPRLQAALFTAVAKIPGVKVVPDAVDAAGRHGVAFSRVGDGWLATETILDPRTYQYLGSRTVAVRDHQIVPDDSLGPWNQHVRAGTVVAWSARVAVGIVSTSGQRP